ncbi:MAG: STAS/SEC14 domain-containing protein [Chloroflexota bacterium]
MPIDISWQQPRRVIYERFHGTITLEEMTAIQQEFLKYLNEGEAPVHAIIDLSGVRDFPKSISQIRQGLVSTGNTQLGRVVLVTGKNPMVRFISSVISQLILKNAQYALCDSLDEATRILRDRDPSVTIEQIG